MSANLIQNVLLNKCNICKYYTKMQNKFKTVKSINDYDSNKY